LTFIRAGSTLTNCCEQISLPNEKRRNATLLYNPKTIDELQKENPSIPWREYFAKILPPTVPIANDEVIIINVPSYLGDLEKLLSNTPKRYERITLKYVKNYVTIFPQGSRKLRSVACCRRNGVILD
jgi:predicted metalloendopeptidase